jgi:hypothetical protein
VPYRLVRAAFAIFLLLVHRPACIFPLLEAL